MNVTEQEAHDEADLVKKTIRCHCDLDNWEPEQLTGHSWVCGIHKEVMRRIYSNQLSLTPNAKQAESP